jgi:hypothetical protein
MVVASGRCSSSCRTDTWIGRTAMSVLDRKQVITLREPNTSSLSVATDRIGKPGPRHICFVATKTAVIFSMGETLPARAPACTLHCIVVELCGPAT